MKNIVCMHNRARVIGAGLAMCGSALILVATFLTQWKLTDSYKYESPDDIIIDFVYFEYGIWMRCLPYASCWGYPSETQQSMMARVTNVLSLVLLLVAYILLFIGEKFFDSNHTRRRRISLAGSASMVLSGILFAATVTCMVFKGSQTTSISADLEITTHYIFGSSLYIGSIGAALSIISGIVIGYAGHTSSKVNDCKKPHVAHV